LPGILLGEKNALQSYSDDTIRNMNTAETPATKNIIKHFSGGIFSDVSNNLGFDAIKNKNPNI